MSEMVIKKKIKEHQQELEKVWIYYVYYYRIMRAKKMEKWTSYLNDATYKIMIKNNYEYFDCWLFRLIINVENLIEMSQKMDFIVILYDSLNIVGN